MRCRRVYGMCCPNCGGSDGRLSGRGVRIADDFDSADGEGDVDAVFFEFLQDVFGEFHACLQVVARFAPCTYPQGEGRVGKGDELDDGGGFRRECVLRGDDFVDQAFDGGEIRVVGDADVEVATAQGVSSDVDDRCFDECFVGYPNDGVVRLPKFDGEEPDVFDGASEAADLDGVADVDAFFADEEDAADQVG